MKAYERLLSYVNYPTVSDEANASCPSTESQREFGKLLVGEMLDMGITDANIDENGYVFGTIPATKAGAIPVIGFIAHMDVSCDAPCENVKARVINNYGGGDIVLNEKENIVMRADQFESLKDYIGGDLIVSDGTTLLGCDDKAGIAEILTMAEYLIAHPEIPHGTIKIGFTPDEEIGRGADLFDVKRFGADFAYTVDGGRFGEVEYETFNATSAEIVIKGRSMHPGASKNKMVNASLLAMEFHSMLPPAERPEYTEGREGFYHLMSMSGRAEEARLGYILRDHDLGILKRRKEFVLNAAAYMNAKYGAGTVEVALTDSYLNMTEEIKKHWHLITNAFKAVEQAGGEPHSIPVRGGTDGSRLSFMGLPCPNLGTGCHNAHSRMEFASIQSMDKCTQSLVNIAKIYAKSAPAL